MSVTQFEDSLGQAGCVGCPRLDYAYEPPNLPPNKFVPPSGLGGSGVMVVGDSPWIEEVKAVPPRPFAGPAGRLLDRLLKRVGGATRDELVITNSFWCRPPHLGWTDNPEKCPDSTRALQHCAPNLDRLIAERKPRVLLALGGVALRRLTGKIGIEAHAGYLMDTRYGIPCIPAPHPSAILQGNQQYTPLLIFAIQRALALAKGELKPDKPLLILDPPIGELMDYLSAFRGRVPELIVDIETPDSGNLDEEERDEAGSSFTIIRAGFSLRPGEAVTFPWQPPYLEPFRALMERTDLVIEHSHNHFDTKRLRANGIPVGRAASSMWLFHWLHPDLRKGLGACAPFFWCGPPWKELASAEPAYYNCMDNLGQGLVWWRGRAELEKQGRWENFWRHCVLTDEILTEMGGRGISRSEAVRQRVLGELNSEYDRLCTELQPMIPPELFVPKQKKGLKTAAPKSLDGLVKRKFRILGEDLSKEEKNKLGYLEGRDNGIWVDIERWCRLTPFNPKSSTQCVALIKHLGLKVPKNRKTGEETAAAKFLERLAGKGQYPVFKKILDARQPGTYASLQLISADGLPAPDGATQTLKTTYGWNPATLRKNSVNCNLMVFPKRAKLADSFRTMFVSDPGTIFVTADSAAIEAVLVGYFAGSERLIRLARAGIHGWLEMAWLGKSISLDLSFDELQRQCKAAKREDPKLYDRCKRVVYLSLFGGRPEKIFEEYPEDFDTLAQARDLQDFFLKSEPGQDVVRWQQDVCRQVGSGDNSLTNPFGYKRYLYGIWRFDTAAYHRAQDAGLSKAQAVDQAWKPGTDYNKAIAQNPQSTASAIQTEILLDIAANHVWMRPFLRLIIHDELVTQVPEADASRVAETLYQVFEQLWPQLGGLSVGSVVSMGRNLGPKSATNPDGMEEVAR